MIDTYHKNNGRVYANQPLTAWLVIAMMFSQIIVLAVLIGVQRTQVEVAYFTVKAMLIKIGLSLNQDQE